MGKDEKPKYLLSIFKKYNPQQVIIFSNFKNKVPRVAQFLSDNGYPALGISSLMTQTQRNRVIERFKSENKHNIMVATDLAARGLDIKGVDLVINFELPEDAENYVHRIGRTGRAEQKGMAISFVSDRDVESLVRIEEYLKEKLETLWMEDTEFVTDFKPMPVEDFYKPQFDKRGPPSDRGPRRGGNDGRRPRRDFDNRRKDSAPRGEARSDRHPQAKTVSNGSSPGAMHRDRKSGRHKQPQGEREQRQDRFNDRNANGGRKKFHKNDRYKKSYDNKKSSTSSKPQSKSTLWGRISSKLKQLVGG